MASASQLKALVQSYVDGDDDRFLSVALQVAAHEARLGHGKLATELREAIDEAKRRRGAASLVSISKPRGELANLLQVSQPSERLSGLILHPTLSRQIERVIREQRAATSILEQGLSPRRKLLFVGPPGTGKTLTASVLAGELGLPLLQVRLDGLITRFMGETAAKLRQIFDATGRMRGIYLFDEFDAIGSGRGLANDVGEIRRVVNSFLMMIEQDSSRSLVIAATNHPSILDRALFRRFDDVLHYDLPDADRAAKLLETRLSSKAAPQVCWEALGKEACPLSHAEITRAADEALKDVLIRGEKECVEADIRAMLEERKAVAARLPEGTS
ncbi:MAG: ATP-binding protein [Gammaproteobacteria bacterium]|nr:ATP-binding protein [Gammaproteobacteria bacterium]